ncbi:hypothetical protein HS088_TW17G00072 [Tripterygium wilfordii]|uniref:Uncharacterized protein n=2 Tax=Tripterygium wilfordii TaxID=458696 RepID=A0A7J7CF28_TRIWF|nr:hypothetical protein HS088_TW17G00072 [Tripterygium wilfordii]
MEEKQLDFNQPFLSVRRFTSTVASSEAKNNRKRDNSKPKIPSLPAYRSELKSGPIRNPGTVPFLWEKTPGKPKDERKLQTHALQRPPGRIFYAKQQTSNTGSDGKTATQSHRDTTISSSGNASYLDESVAKYGNSKNEMEETTSSSSDDGDEAYVDALDTLSQTESSFFNCSVSGVSGLDGPDMKPHGIFSTDPQTRDLMMGRFLPAAKAMASESPQYTFRKQPVAREQQPRQMKQLVSVEKRRPLNQNRPNNMAHYMQRNVVEESEDEDEDYNAPRSSSIKVCGLLPRFCLQLNPVPGLKKHTHGPVFSVRRARAKSSYATSCAESESEHGKGSGFVQCSTTTELREELSQIRYGSDSRKLDRSSMYNLLQGDGGSPCHHDDKGSLALSEDSKDPGVSSSDRSSKGARNFRELLACDSSKWESDSASPLVEKTLYVDSVHKVKSPVSSSNSSDMKGLIDYQGYDAQMPFKSRESDENSMVNSFFKDIEKLNVVGGKAKLQPESLESVDTCFQSSSDKSIHEVQMDVPKQDLMQDSITIASEKMTEEEKIDSESQLHRKSDKPQSNQIINHECIMSTDDGKIDLEHQLAVKLRKQESCFDLPLPPPLPPTESWLKRTLPTVSSRNSSLQSRSHIGMNFHSKAQASKTPALDPKWEMIVRTKNVQLGHLRHTEEILAPIPEA